MQSLGASGERVTPDPFPNSAVKPLCADDTPCGESRQAPGLFIQNKKPLLIFKAVFYWKFFEYSNRLRRGQLHCVKKRAMLVALAKCINYN